MKINIDTAFSEILIQNSFELILVCDTDANVIFASPSVEKILGYKNDEIYSSCFLKYVYPEDRTKIYGTIKECKTSGNSINIPGFRVYNKNGDVLTFESACTCHSESGNIIFNARDISYRAEMEKALKNSEAFSNEKFHYVSMATKDALWDLDLVTNKLIWGDGYTRLFGYEIDDNESNLLEWQNHIHPEDMKIITESFDKAIEEKHQTWSYEYRFICKNGATKIVNDRAYIIYDKRGIPIRMVGAMQDITDKRQNHETIHKLSAALEQSLNAVIIVTGSGIIEYVNEKFIRENPNEDFIGKDFCELNPFDLVPEETEKLSNYLRIGFKREYQFSKTVSGKTKWYCACISPILKDGKLINSLVIIEDITARKEALMSLSEAKEKAESASTIKSQFLANISHEIRTPLNGIIGLTDLMYSTDINAEQTEFLDMIKYSSDNLLKLIEGILDLSKIEAQTLKLNKNAFNISEMLTNTYNVLLPSASAKNLQFTLENHLDPNDIIYGDSLRINQVVTNLASNAIKFTDSGVIKIEVSETSRCAGKINICIKVSDTGIGISPDKTDAIFETFTQLDSTFKKSYQGAGLGLSIVKNLVGLMDGDIKVKSTPGKGSVFICTLPLELPAADFVPGLINLQAV